MVGWIHHHLGMINTRSRHDNARRAATASINKIAPLNPIDRSTQSSSSSSSSICGMDGLIDRSIGRFDSRAGPLRMGGLGAVGPLLVDAGACGAQQLLLLPSYAIESRPHLIDRPPTPLIPSNAQAASGSRVVGRKAAAVQRKGNRRGVDPL